MYFDLTEFSAECDVLFNTDVLVAKKDDLMFEKRVVNLLELNWG